MPADALTPAERQREYQRAYRERLKRGLSCFLGYAPSTLVADLINAGLLTEGEALNKKSLGMAVVEAASLWIRNQDSENCR